MDPSLLRKLAEEDPLLQYKEQITAAALKKETGDADSFGFSYETMDTFSESPLDFEEYAEALMDDLSDIYALTGMYNRFSPNYLSSCELLEKIIRQLGRCCVTKEVLEQKGFAFPKLERLTVGSLYGSLSFNFRKCHAAVKEGRQKNIVDLKLLKMECRLYELAEHLKATAEKVSLIRSGKIDPDTMLDRAVVFRRSPSQTTAPSLRRIPDGKPKALPILGSVAREMIRERTPKLPAMIPGVRPFQAGTFRPVSDEQVVRHLKKKHDAAENQKKPSASISAGAAGKEIDQGIRQAWDRMADFMKADHRYSDRENAGAAQPHSESSPGKRKKKKKR